jgi:pilus assembly protein CpaD
MTTGPESDRARQKQAGGLKPSCLGRRLAMPLLAAALLAGCQSHHSTNPTTGSLRSDGYRTRYPITVEDAPVTMDIPIGHGKYRMNGSLRTNIQRFSADAVANGTGEFAILVPTGAANDAVAASMAQDIAREVEAGGMPRSLIQHLRYPAGDVSANAPIRLGYTRIKAVTPPCGRWQGDILPTVAQNGDAENFGCANQANLAAMVENPYDLIQPRAATGAPSWRRWFMFDKYRIGESPSGTYEDADVTTQDGGG